MVGRSQRRGSSGAVFARMASVSALAVGLAGVTSCGSGKARGPEPRPTFWSNSPPKCPADHTREYYCDDLMPLASGAPAPEPYENCPVQTEAHAGRFESTPPVAVFDSSYTEYTRRRAPPGHACCYSWCSGLELAQPEPAAAQAACASPSAFREELCFAAPEGGTSQPVHPAYAACPVAVVPPRKVSFSVPKAAHFDERATAARYRVGLAECCYSWCSVAPPASGL